MSESTIIVSGPNGRYVVHSPSDAVRQVENQHRKRNETMGRAQRACIAQFAQTGTNIIQERTKAGLDFRGEKFGDYSAGYAKLTGKSTVDLTDTGGMLNDLFWRQSGDGLRAIITFRGLRHRKRARGLARGNWRVWTKIEGQRRFVWLSELNKRAPRRRIMGFQNEADRRRLLDEGLKVFKRIMVEGLRYRRGA